MRGGERKQAQQSLGSFSVRIHNKNTAQQRTHEHMLISVDTLGPGLCVSVCFERDRRTNSSAASLGGGQRSPPRLLLLTMTPLAWRDRTTGVKRVMENKEHLTYHSLASKWVASWTGTDEGRGGFTG